jgi:outer membrane protein insertion porin family
MASTITFSILLDKSHGGDLYYSGTMAFMVPLFGERFKNWPVRFQLFGNGGSLVCLTNASSSSLQTSFQQLIHLPRVSVGIGLVIRAKIARVELNYSWPILTHTQDRLKRGFQVGLGMTFM